MTVWSRRRHRHTFMEGERSRRILCVCVCDDMSAPGVLQDRTPLMVQTDDASVSSHRVRNTKILKTTRVQSAFVDSEGSTLHTLVPACLFLIS